MDRVAHLLDRVASGDVSPEHLAALLAMLNSRAAGVTVVNIDSGFAAAAAASRITRLAPGEPT